MSSNDDRERARLQRLQEQQLRARDPGPRVKVDWKNVKPKKQEPLLASIWHAIPGRGRGLLFGFFMGIFFSIVINYAVSAVLAERAIEQLNPAIAGAICGGAAFVASMALGAYLGKITEDEDTGI